VESVVEEEIVVEMVVEELVDVVVDSDVSVNDTDVDVVSDNPLVDNVV